MITIPKKNVVHALIYFLIPSVLFAFGSIPSFLGLPWLMDTSRL